MKYILDTIHNLFSKSYHLTLLLVKIKNQIILVLNKRYASNSINPIENGEEQTLLTVLEKCNTFFDVGANKGDWTSLLLERKPNAKVYLFEPGKIAFKEIQTRFSLNKNIEVFQYGLSDKVGETSFFEEPNAGEMSSIIKKWANSNCQEINIQLTTIDNQIEDRGLKSIDYLKIDTEGYDFLVLRGSLKTLTAQKIKYIQFEYNKAWEFTGTSILDAYEMLTSCGYKIFIMRKDGLYNFNPLIMGDFYCYSNFFACLDSEVLTLNSLTKGRF